MRPNCDIAGGGVGPTMKRYGEQQASGRTWNSIRLRLSWLAGFLLCSTMVLLELNGSGYRVVREVPVYIRDDLTSLPGGYRNCADIDAGVALIPSQQRLRKHNIAVMCRDRRNDTRVKVGQLANIMVDDEHRALYCVVPKVGCTNWKRTLVSLSPLSNLTLNDTSNIRVHSDDFLKRVGLNYLHKFTKEEIIYKLIHYYKFIFVRHPLERVLSAYIDKFTRYNKYTRHFQTKYGRYIVKKYRENANVTSIARGDDVTFPEFVRYLIGAWENGEEFNPHWRTYYELCHPCKIYYNFVGKMETIRSDSFHVLSNVAPDQCPPQFPQSPTGGAQSTSNKISKYFSNIPQEDLNKLTEIYNMDIQMFGYSKELPIH